MAEYWKSTPKYWCKHCSVFVRDTPLERRNHESTAKHQGAIKRSLRDLHRSADQEEREKERARREVERLNGVVSGSGSTTPRASGSGSGGAGQKGGHKPGGGGAGGAGPTGANAAAVGLSEADRQRQLEQLAELGVNIPTELRGSMALAGDWEVTNVRVVNEDAEIAAAGQNAGAGGAGVIPVGAEGRAVGVKRERERTEEEKEQEEAIKGLFKRPKKWGVGSRVAKMEEDKELEELLSGGIPLKKEEKGAVKTEEEQDVKKEDGDEQDGEVSVKQEEDGVEGGVKKEENADAEEDSAMSKIPAIKSEPNEALSGIADEVTPPLTTGESGATAAATDAVPAVVFKKRKPKNVRQK
ncbi:hypothetical protein GE21DRAFT_9246 [Neurospora crassa]|uniref:U1-type domain-containing protein n=2 Tax=Neurospora crassa TaxID=5141 RepID=Q7RZI3_NEUCR|nr:hypothetical protein NCU04032 [Neurospora crassa OR74A]EAA28411.1 hypothetical protein NCU04032 [Neurospora crassa OR74A]KHE86220.1 hypothetical protein GE21DRAFT_9246 [Neurospora crassa]CAE85591.1 conserved hypothetical protein [Neurospora crassa]|eukprot:XP_957647.1 hypothetical protein NCU04032 [Neurospora crassa OR74A]